MAFYMANAKRLGAAAALVLALGVAAGAAPPCAFDTNGDGAAEIVVPDVDGDGVCDWPTGTTSLPGTLTLTAGTPVQFRGKTVVAAGSIVVEAGGRLVGRPETLQRLYLRATGNANNDVRNRGTLDIEASDDVIVQARRTIDLGGTTNVRAANNVILRAVVGDVVIAPPAFTPGAFTLFARNRVDINARSANGNVDIARARIGAFRILVKTRASVSFTGPKILRLREGTLLTTNRNATGLPNASNIQLNATGDIILSGATLDAGTSVTLLTQRQTDRACLSSSRLEAQDGIGYLYVRGVHGGVFHRDTDFFGRLVGGDLLVDGPCDSVTTTTRVGATTTSSTRPGATTTTTLGSGLQSAQWQFYVRIARADGSETNVSVPRRSTDPPVSASIRADHIPAFSIGDQVTEAQIQALGGDTFARLVDAASVYIQTHPADYPDFVRVVNLHWAKRVS